MFPWKSQCYRATASRSGTIRQAALAIGLATKNATVFKDASKSDFSQKCINMWEKQMVVVWDFFLWNVYGFFLAFVWQGNGKMWDVWARKQMVVVCISLNLRLNFNHTSNFEKQDVYFSRDIWMWMLNEFVESKSPKNLEFWPLQIENGGMKFTF